MSSINAISVEQLARLIGTPKCPALIDVRSDEDFAADPRLLPGALRRPHAGLRQWSQELRGRSVIAMCRRGERFSHGVAAWLRHDGAAADVLDGGFEAWKRADLPLVPEARLPRRDAEGRTVWVTRERPKVDRIACPWLIRRFVDPAAIFLFVKPSETLAVAEQLARLDLAPEAPGLLAASLGLSRMYDDDLAQLEAGMGLYDAFYRWCRDATSETHNWPTNKPRGKK
jgi:rhodanese-related sulfurtransferase